MDPALVTSAVVSSGALRSSDTSPVGSACIIIDRAVPRLSGELGHDMVLPPGRLYYAGEGCQDLALMRWLLLGCHFCPAGPLVQPRSIPGATSQDAAPRVAGQ